MHMCLAVSGNTESPPTVGRVPFYYPWSKPVCPWPFSLVESGCFIGISPPLSFERPALLGLSLVGTIISPRPRSNLRPLKGSVLRGSS